MAKTYPDFFPEGCPPPDAYEADLVVYRYIKNDPPSDDDFKSYYELSPKEWCGKINAYGLSVISSLDSAVNAMDINPALRKKYKFISSGLIQKHSGVIQKTPSRIQKDHITWWVCKNYSVSSFFSVCRESNG